MTTTTPPTRHDRHERFDPSATLRRTELMGQVLLAMFMAVFVVTLFVESRVPDKIVGVLFTWWILWEIVTRPYLDKRALNRFARYMQLIAPTEAALFPEGGAAVHPEVIARDGVAYRRVR